MDAISPTYWDNESNVKAFLSFVANELRIEGPDDWYKVPEEHIYGNAHGKKFVIYFFSDGWWNFD